MCQAGEGQLWAVAREGVGCDGSCERPPGGPVSISAAPDAVELMIGNDTKKLSGLDVSKVEKGQDNWARLQRLASEVFGASAARAKKQRIDDVETRRLTEFLSHLGESDHARCCAERGSHDEGEERTTRRRCCRLFDDDQAFPGRPSFLDAPDDIIEASTRRWPCKWRASLQ